MEKMEKIEKRVYIDEIDISEFEGSLDDIINKIENYKSDEYSAITVNHDTGTDDYGEIYACVTFYGSRLETDAEFELRMNTLAKKELDKYLAKQAEEIKEKELYIKLKQKYES
jgi:tetrahydromethanopterin S-methyltransferase subunit G